MSDWLYGDTRSFANPLSNSAMPSVNEQKAFGPDSHGNYWWDYFNGNAAARESNSAQWQMQLQQQEFNASEAEKTRAWNEYMSNTAIRRQMEDIKAAGLNPWLAIQGGASGAASMAGANATSGQGNANQANNNIVMAAAITTASVLALIGKFIRKK